MEQGKLYKHIDYYLNESSTIHAKTEALRQYPFEKVSLQDAANLILKYLSSVI